MRGLDRRRLLIVLGIVVVAAVVAVVAIVVGTGNGSSGSTTSASGGSGSTASGVVSESALQALQGLPQHGDTLGNPSAPATIEVYEDPQCPYCQQWSLQTFPTVAVDYVKTGKVKLVYRGVQIVGPNSNPALRAIYAAGEQNKLWNMVEELYERQGAENSGWVTPALLTSAATKAGVDATKMTAAMPTPTVTRELAQAQSAFSTSGAGGTPSFYLLQPPAVPLQIPLPALDPQTFTSALDSVLQQR